MFIIIDKRIPELAKKRLTEHGKLIELSTNGIGYEAISGHPDIFFCKVSDYLVTAPNLPETLWIKLQELKESRILFGNNTVGNIYPETAHYNAVVTDNCLIHNLSLTDKKILDLCKDKEQIHVEQGYTRCNLLSLKNNHFITSDRGIEKTLINHGKTALYVNPENIKLPGFPHGFFGGVCGVLGDEVLIIGRINYLKESSEIGIFLKKLGYQLIELYKGSPFDGGGIIFTP